MSGTLYIVGTPIGNLDDISPRAAQILRETDFIAAEDTRVSAKLLARLKIKKEMISYFEHNKLSRGEIIIGRLLDGESCALVTDAGMPAVSDPGEELVRTCHERGIDVAVIPGPCAAVCALALSGLPTGRFAFEGFLPVQAKMRKARLAELARETRTLVFYEAPHRLNRTLKDLYAAFGDRRVSIVKEITKIHERVDYTTLEKACTDYGEEGQKGEFVLVLAGFEGKEAPVDDAAVILRLRELLDAGVSRSGAVRQAADELGVPRNAVYRLMNDL